MKISKRTNRLEIIFGVVCIAIIGLWEVLIGFGSFQRVVVPVTLPINGAVIRLSQSLAVPLSPFFHWYRSQRQLQQISESLAQAEGKLSQLEQLKAENAQLRELLENRHLQYTPRHLARPIVSSVAPLVWLDEGSTVKPGWLVLYKDTVLGQVARVEGQYAHISLLTANPELRMLVRTEGGVTGIARARNGRVVVTNIDPDAIVADGERVTTVGQPGVPPGKFIGQVNAVERAVNSAELTLVLDQLVSFYQTSVVEIEE